MINIIYDFKNKSTKEQDDGWLWKEALLKRILVIFLEDSAESLSKTAASLKSLNRLLP